MATQRARGSAEQKTNGTAIGKDKAGTSSPLHAGCPTFYVLMFRQTIKEGKNHQGAAAEKYKAWMGIDRSVASSSSSWTILLHVALPVSRHTTQVQQEAKPS